MIYSHDDLLVAPFGDRLILACELVDMISEGRIASSEDVLMAADRFSFSGTSTVSGDYKEMCDCLFAILVELQGDDHE